VEDVDQPVPGEGEVLVRVHAAGITRGELEWPVDRLPAVPSYELSGVIVDTDEEVFALTPFDRDGVAAEYASVPSTVLAPKPVSLAHLEAAALPMGGLSAWQGLFVHGHLQTEERVLVTGASLDLPAREGAGGVRAGRGAREERQGRARCRRRLAQYSSCRRIQTCHSAPSSRPFGA
jgi:D-arabinose 1-dehydrogenase-like Zn-dependent alcohol dehydrogenase